LDFKQAVKPVISVPEWAKLRQTSTVIKAGAIDGPLKLPLHFLSRI
jgi:hypothetical protein